MGYVLFTTCPEEKQMFSESTTRSLLVLRVIDLDCSWGAGAPPGVVMGIGGGALRAHLGQIASYFQGMPNIAGAGFAALAALTWITTMLRTFPSSVRGQGRALMAAVLALLVLVPAQAVASTGCDAVQAGKLDFDVYFQSGVAVGASTPSSTARTYPNGNTGRNGLKGAGYAGLEAGFDAGLVTFSAGDVIEYKLKVSGDPTISSNAQPEFYYNASTTGTSFNVLATYSPAISQGTASEGTYTFTQTVGANTSAIAISVRRGASSQAYKGELRATCAAAAVATATSLASSLNPSTFGQAVTFTATVSQSPSVGTVAFKDNGTDIAGCATRPISNGTATCTTSALTAGAHANLTAVYSGGSGFVASTSSPLSQTVNTSTDATLSGLVASAGTLSPAFAPATEAYSLTVANAVTTTTVTPTVNNAGANVAVAGNVVPSGTPSAAINLSEGSNPISIVVSPQSGPIKTYVITVTRLSGTSLALASSLNPSSIGAPVTYTATLSGGIAPTGTVTFKDNGTDIVNCVAVPLVSSQATCTHNSSNGYTVATHPITASYSGDSNNATSASNTVSQVVRSNVATLSSLTTSAGGFDQPFASGTTAYTKSVANSVSSITVTPTASEANATIKVNNVTVGSGAASGSISLIDGNNNIAVEVTGQDGVAFTIYGLTVTRLGAPTITSITPSSGPAAGNTGVTIVGTNLTGATAVTIGGSAVTGLGITATQITGTTSAGTAGAANVVVTTPGGTATLVGGFTYIPVPVANSFSASAVAYNPGGASATTLSVATQVSNSPTSYAVTSATTANGGSVSITNAGIVSYTPPTGFRGNDSFQYNATNSAGTSPNATVTVPVNNPVFATTLTGSGTRGTALSGVQVNTTGGLGAYSCNPTPVSGALPSGTTLNSNCTITGTPTTSSPTPFSFTVSVTDSSVGTGPYTATSGPLSLTINAPTLSMTPSAGSLPGAVVGAAYTRTFTATGGTGPYTYVSGGTLPAGLTLAGGTLSGTPT
ncbi:MAG: hypothetical protein EOP62_19840, partial [Sphingomonadales bacterium]